VVRALKPRAAHLSQRERDVAMGTTVEEGRRRARVARAEEDQRGRVSWEGASSRGRTPVPIVAKSCRDFAGAIAAHYSICRRSACYAHIVAWIQRPSRWRRVRGFTSSPTSSSALPDWRGARRHCHFSSAHLGVGVHQQNADPGALRSRGPQPARRALRTIATRPRARTTSRAETALIGNSLSIPITDGGSTWARSGHLSSAPHRGARAA
jgi:hypothetical protein